jgi:hypothetical protein
MPNPFRFDLSGETRSGNMGAQFYERIASDEEFPGISESGDVTDFPDPHMPALPRADRSVLGLLEQIRDKLPDRSSQQVWMQFAQTLTTAAAQKTFRHIPEWRFFYLANPTTRDLMVYLGNGSSTFLGKLPAGRSMRGEMPFPQDSLTVTWPAGGTDTEQISLIVTSGKIDVALV